MFYVNANTHAHAKDIDIIIKLLGLIFLDSKIYNTLELLCIMFRSINLNARFI